MSKRTPYTVVVAYRVDATSRESAQRCALALTEHNGAFIACTDYVWEARNGRVQSVRPDNDDAA